ncbi:unnamed protein product [Clavelina lepadiformis]|uniref:Peptidase M12B domain-containing protein n=1 Tax=Clavelina lepadiformis TaxID=159417 RepID=A0ABP0GPK0_CLALP
MPSYCIFFIICLASLATLTTSRTQIRVDVKPSRKERSAMESEVTTPVRMQEDLSGAVASRHFRRRRSIEEDSLQAKDEFESPVYKINAFGSDLMLRLERDESLIAPAFTTVYSWRNKTRDFPSKATSLRKCFYKGAVIGLPSSQVVLSICDSLTGSIYTGEYHYSIAPVDADVDSEEPVAHTIQRRSIGAKRSSSGSSSCGVNDKRHDRRYQQTFFNSPIEEEVAQRAKRSAESSERNIIDFEIEGDDVARSRSKRSSFDSRQYHIETMVVADATMVRDHGDDLEHYILSIMMVANRVFSHPSLGSAVAISVVKIMIIEDGEAGPPVSTNAAHTLHDFCHWQKRHNTPDDSDPEHHDLAILLTKTDLCGDSCDTLGMAEVGAMCSSRHSCAVVEDDGLSASYTVAHEVGHVLNMMHDDNRLCRENFANLDPQSHVMSSTMERVDSEQPWSSCSRQAVLDYLQDGRGDCLLDKPQDPKVYPSGLPGEMYDVNSQCEMSFGKGAVECPYMRECSRLWCQLPSGARANQCHTKSFPRADGSPCSTGMHCMKGLCVPEQPEMAPVDGRWGGWSPFGSCSRSCGGGIMMSSRQCNNPAPRHGGKYCTGSRLQFRSCNIERCPTRDGKETDFRSEQCAQYNGQRFPLLGVRVASTWVPRYSEVQKRDRCKLICQSVQTGSYITLGDRVVDGTRCGPDTTDVCVHGQCMPAGCDGILGSKAKYNKCGICKGSKSECKKVRGKYNARRAGYNDVLTLPVGAASIKIKQRGFHNKVHDGNYLALVNSKGRYLLNGALTLSTVEKDIEVNGSLLQYSGVRVASEKIEAKMPLKEEITVQVLSVQLAGAKILPPRISYSYYIVKPKKSSRRSKISRIATDDSIGLVNRLRDEPSPRSDPAPTGAAEEDRWVTGRWRKCKTHGTRKCGSGWKKRSVTCKRGKFPSTSCDAKTRPYHRLPCFVSNCPTVAPINQRRSLSPRRHGGEQPVWNAGMWGPCSTSCGLGTKMRVVICQTRSRRLLSNSMCDQGTRPSQVHGCKLRECR